MSKVRIGVFQLFTIFVNLVFGKAIGYTNGVVARAVGNDTWLAMTIAFLTGIAIIPALVWLSVRRGGESPMEYIPKLFGRVLGSVVMLLLGGFFCVAYATSAITITQHINDYLMTESPLLLFVAGYTLLAAYGVYLGLEVAARLSVVGLIMTVLLNLSMVLGSVKHMELTQLLPLFDHGVLPVVAASARADTDVGIVTAAALLLLPLTNASGAKLLKAGVWGLAAGLVLVVTWSIFEITVLGPEVTAQFLVACMQMARAAELSIYLHRYELIMVIMFVYGVITQSVVCLYCATGMIEGALPFKVRRGYLISALALIVMGIQYYLAYDRDRYGAFLAILWPVISVVLALGLPLLICLVALFRPPASPKKASV
ncbi:MAG TPA: GerAB/ArcD/ProY family transporter [Symbiobacteriaceae bacterium]|nr:GerAB/ArcD/ProY family transporter [Symbiobacteriaceae bacterium]